MNLPCTHCEQPTIARKWLVYLTLFPYLFLFLQVRCGRCRQQQRYELDVHFLLNLFLSLVVPVLLLVVALYVMHFTGLHGGLTLLAFLVLYGLVCAIKLMFLLRKYRPVKTPDHT